MRYRFEIDDQNAVRFWDDENPTENGAPFFFQPDHPDARPWLDYDEALAWTTEFLNNLLAALEQPAEEEI
jgi:hypothetical protein